MSDDSILITVDEIDLLSENRGNIYDIVEFLSKNNFKNVVFGIDVLKSSDKKENTFLYEEIKKNIKEEMDGKKFSYKILTDEEKNENKSDKNNTDKNNNDKDKNGRNKNDKDNNDKDRKKYDVYFLINYTGRREISEVFKKIYEDESTKNTCDETNNTLNTQGIKNTKKKITEKLIVPTMPDLIICCGKQTLPDMMIWQTAYSELYFSEKAFSKMNEKDLKKAIEDYKSRVKRHGR